MEVSRSIEIPALETYDGLTQIMNPIPDYLRSRGPMGGDRPFKRN
jgi:hypothetical protein